MRARNAQETGLIHSLQLLGGFNGRAERLQTYNLYLGDSDRLAWDLKRYREVTTKDLSDALETYLKKNKRLIVYAKPKPPSKSGPRPKKGKR